MMDDAAARAVVLAAFAKRGLADVQPAELQLVQAIGRFEGRYGDWGNKSHNWGAIQCGHHAPCKAGCFEHGDSHADGSKYRGCFRRYETPVDGCADLIRELYRRLGVRDAARLGDATKVAERMRATGYFEAPADKYAFAIEKRAALIAGALGEPHFLRRGGGAPPPNKPPAPPPAPPRQPVVPLPHPGSSMLGGFGGGAAPLPHPASWVPNATPPSGPVPPGMAPRRVRSSMGAGWLLAAAAAGGAWWLNRRFQ